MSSLTAPAICCPAFLPPVKIKGLSRSQVHFKGPAPLGIRPLCIRAQSCSMRPISLSRRRNFDSMICAGANPRCSGASQTQTVTRESSTITVAPVQGKEKDPKIDDQGPGLPPRDDGGGGGGGGGGGWGGGFFFFGFLALLGLLKDEESDDKEK